MVRLRLKRMGNKHRPFYRIVAAKSTAARDGAFIEAFGHYNPLTNPKQIEIDAERAHHWLMIGAQPSETVAYLLKKEGILDKFFAERPKARESYKFLDKTTAAMSQQSVVGGSDNATAVEEAPAEEAPAVEEAATEEQPAAEEGQPEAEAAAEAEPAAEESAPAAEEEIPPTDTDEPDADNAEENKQ